MNKFKRFMRKLKNKKGSFSIEAVIAMTGILMVTFLGIAYFTYLAPRQVLTQDIQALAQTAKIQGGLTDETSEPGNSDVERFKERLEKKGFDSNEIEISAIASYTDATGTKIERSVMGVEPLNVGYVDESIYSHRNSKEIITIYVQIPANMNFINAMSNYWSGEDSGLGDYKFSDTIMSERW